MKNIMYATIALFIGILIVVIVIAHQTPVRTVTYENGMVVETKK